MKVVYVTTVPLRHATDSPKFDVSFPEILLKIVANLGYIFALGGRTPPGPVWGAKVLPQAP